MSLANQVGEESEAFNRDGRTRALALAHLAMREQNHDLCPLSYDERRTYKACPLGAAIQNFKNDDGQKYAQRKQQTLRAALNYLRRNGFVN